MATALASRSLALRPHTRAPRDHNKPRTISSIVPRVAMREPSALGASPGRTAAAAAADQPHPEAPPPEDPGEFHHTPILSPHNAQLVCGRLAMLGFAAGVLGELAHGTPLLAQFAAAEPATLTAAFVLSLASAAPLLAGEEEGDEVAGPFTPEAEILNGNLAIAGVAAMQVIEALKGSALL